MHTSTKCSGSYGMSLVSGDLSTLYPAGSRRDIWKERIRFMSAERNRFLLDDWIRRLAQWKHYQMIFIDESAANELTKDRKCDGCVPRGRSLWNALAGLKSRLLERSGFAITGGEHGREELKDSD